MLNRVTFINHATVLLEMDGMKILTDPVYSRSISYFLPRLKRPGIPFDELPQIDVILISHNHYDHMNLRTLRKLKQRHQSRIVVPRGNAEYAFRCGFDRVDELHWWEALRFDEGTITCVPAKHFSGRKPWDRNTSAYGGYVVESNRKTVYFAGDTAYDSFFTRLGATFSIDVALLPIGAYKPYNWFSNIHLNPGTAVQAFLDCKAKNLVPIHWGTFKISDEPMSEPPVLLRQEAEKAGISDRVHILENGETFNF